MTTVIHSELRVSRQENPPLLEVDDLSVSFPSERGLVRAVQDVTIRVQEGRSLGIVGESGSGKSVLCRAIMNILAPGAVIGEDTQIRFRGTGLGTMSRRERQHFWGVEVAMVFQDPMTSLTPVLTIGKQLVEPLVFHLSMSKSEARTTAIDLLARVGIADPERRFDQYPHSLSGGMRQRVSIALALACSPALLIADEPTTALDVTVQQQILDLLQSLQGERQMGVILISHDLGVIASRTDDVVVMYAGQIVERGPTKEVFASPRHPYTRGLIDSIPRLDQPRHSRLHTIPGRIRPKIGNEPGCHFAPRCDRAQQRCLSETPALVSDGATTEHACFFPIGTAAGDAALESNWAAGETATGRPLNKEATIS